MRASALVCALACLFVAPPAADAEYSVRVGPEYFGVNYPLLPFDSPEVRATQLRAIRAAGITTVRGALSWQQMEPDAPVGGVHTYDWTASDHHVAEIARYGLSFAPAFLYTPAWAAPGSAVTCNGGQSATKATSRPADYAAAAAALVARYGPNGTFWAAHPELPKVPIKVWQIWNEPNLVTFWCPRPDPAAYAELFTRAAAAIHDADPSARVITSGLVISSRSGSYMSTADFYAGMAAARPGLWWHADGIGFHVYPPGTLSQQFDQIARMREHVTAAGAPTTLPLHGTEVGWGLAEFGLTEEQRAARYAYLTENIPSTNCNVAVMYAQAWTTSPPGGVVYDYDSGIADRTTGALYPSGIAFRDAINVLSGRGEREASHENLRHCANMPKLDRDADGRAEHRDYYPLDPSRWKGPPGWYDGIRLSAARKQALGKQVALRARCDEACRLTISGRLAVRGDQGKAKLRLKKLRTRLKGDRPKRLRLELPASAVNRIRRGDGTQGKAKIKAVAMVEGERFGDRIKVRLSRR